MGLGFVVPGGGGIPDAPSDGNLYGRQDGAWVEIAFPPGTEDTVHFEFSRGGNTNTGAPIGPDSGANNAPGFVVVEPMTLTAWSMSFRETTTPLTAGLNITVVSPSNAWSVTTTQVTAAAVKNPATDEQEATASTSIALVAEDLVRITSAVNDGGANIVITQVTAVLQGRRT